jgi:hypothetical protein
MKIMTPVSNIVSNILEIQNEKCELIFCMDEHGCITKMDIDELARLSTDSTNRWVKQLSTLVYNLYSTDPHVQGDI